MTNFSICTQFQTVTCIKKCGEKTVSRIKSKVGLKAGVNHFVAYWLERNARSCHCQKSLPLMILHCNLSTSQSNWTLLIRRKISILAANQLYLLSKLFSLSLVKQEMCAKRSRADSEPGSEASVSAKQAKGLKLPFGSTVATLEERDHFLLVCVGKDLAWYQIISSFKNKANNWIKPPLKGSYWQRRKAVLASQLSFSSEYCHLSL